MQAAARQCVRRLLSATAGAGPSSLQASAGAASLAGFGAWSRAGAGNGAAEALAGMRFDGGQLFRGFASPVHTVDVQQNNVDRAFKKLRRKMIDSGLFKELKERVYHQKPSQLRILEWKEHEKRVAKKRLNFKLKWIMRKKNAGF